MDSNLLADFVGRASNHVRGFRAAERRNGLADMRSRPGDGTDCDGGVSRLIFSSVWAWGDP